MSSKSNALRGHSARKQTANTTGPNERLVTAMLVSGHQLSTLVTPVGAGFSRSGEMAITRWTPDATCQSTGYFIYCRDLDTGAFWSTTLQPIPDHASRYDFGPRDDRIEIIRETHGIESRLSICVTSSTADCDIELRECTLTNLGNMARRIELTSYVEFVLSTLAADAAHPAFSKLFLDTEYLAERTAILTHRRRRSAEDTESWAAHWCLGGEPPGEDTSSGFETDRMRFIGRGRSLASPQALAAAAPLTGMASCSLESIGALRRVVFLEPGASQSVTFCLAAAGARDRVERCVEQIATEEGAALAAGSARSTVETTNSFAAHVEAHHPGCSEVAGVVGPECQTAGFDRPPAEFLQFFNGYGGFSADGTEYVLRIATDTAGQRTLPPLPWINVVANRHGGFLVSETGAGYTWHGNSRENRLTPWSNDPVCDPHGEAIYIRDESDSSFWSPLPGPAPATGSEYEVCHGFGYTRFAHTSHGLKHDVTQFVPRDDPVKVTILRLTNDSERRRELSLYSYAQWVLGGSVEASAKHVCTELCDELGAVFARNEQRDNAASCVAFSAVSAADDRLRISASGDRSAFLGELGTVGAPRAVRTTDPLDGRFGRGLDPCAALHARLILQPGESFDSVFLLGEATNEEEAAAIIRRLGDPATAENALLDARAFWQELFGRVEVETPSPALNQLLAGWLLYQDLSCRIWGRSAFYQSGGAFGYRDQLQDAAAFTYHWPELVREQILLHAAHQFEEGDVLHWWHPPNSLGIRTRFSDDLLWLPYITAHYIRTTGETAILDEEVRFLTARPLADGEQEALLAPEESGTSASLLEHCCRAIDRSLAAGVHGLPKMGCGDWNDGMNRVGAGGSGESVWLGFFLYEVLHHVIPWCQRRGETDRVAAYRRRREDLRTALNDAGWDGAWYRRAFYDDGTPLGSAANDECRIDALSQAWAVLSGAAPPDRAAMAMQAVEEHLVDERGGLIRLLTPAFDKTPHDPGYIKGYLPGIRENGGQYTHGVLWVIRAMAELGRGERAVRLLEMLNPIHHARTTDEVATYQVEPYVVAADVYGEPPYVGRGGWTWYTGSAGWMYRIALESILGVRMESGKTLVIDPRMDPNWPAYRVRLRLPNGAGEYDVRVENPNGKETGVTLATLDGKPIAVEDAIARIPLAEDGGSHAVTVRI